MRAFHYHDTLSGLQGEAVGGEIIDMVDAGSLGADSLFIAVGDEWRGFAEMEPTLADADPPPLIEVPPDRVPVHVPSPTLQNPADGRGEKVRALLDGKRRWDWIERELEPLRRDYSITGIIRAEAKAQIILDVEEGSTVLDSVKKRAPDSISKNSNAQQPPPLPFSAPVQSTHNSTAGVAKIVIAIVVIFVLWILFKAF